MFLAVCFFSHSPSLSHTLSLQSGTALPFRPSEERHPGPWDNGPGEEKAQLLANMAEGAQIQGGNALRTGIRRAACHILGAALIPPVFVSKLHIETKQLHI